MRILDDTRILWLNLSGSGNETAGHLALCNRLTLMFCAFEGDALILRVYGQAKVIHPRDAGWAQAIAAFPEMAGSRRIFDMHIDKVQTSCGTGVPVMPFSHDRVDTELLPYYDDMAAKGVEAFGRKKNMQTIDGFDTKLFGD